MKGQARTLFLVFTVSSLSVVSLSAQGGRLSGWTLIRVVTNGIAACDAMPYRPVNSSRTFEFTSLR